MMNGWFDSMIRPFKMIVEYQI